MHIFTLLQWPNATLQPLHISDVCAISRTTSSITQKSADLHNTPDIVDSRQLTPNVVPDNIVCQECSIGAELHQSSPSSTSDEAGVHRNSLEETPDIVEPRQLTLNMVPDSILCNEAPIPNSCEDDESVGFPVSFTVFILLT
jgi:hypothetical protein